MPDIPCGDIVIHYESHGSGEPLLLITGLGGVGSSWGPQIPLFSKDYLTLVPDHRGAGRTTAPATGYSIAQHAADMAQLLYALGAFPAHIIGTSTGGAIAQLLALEHPDLVRSLVLASTLGKTDPYYRRCLDMRKQVLRRMGVKAYLELSSVFWWSGRYIRDHGDELSRWEKARTDSTADVEIMLKRMEMLADYNVLDRLGSLRTPTLVICGRQDSCIPPALSEELASRIPGAELRFLEGSHFFHLEAPEAFHAQVRNFLVRH